MASASLKSNAYCRRPKGHRTCGGKGSTYLLTRPSMSACAVTHVTQVTLLSESFIYPLVWGYFLEIASHVSLRHLGRPMLTSVRLALSQAANAADKGPDLL